MILLSRPNIVLLRVGRRLAFKKGVHLKFSEQPRLVGGLLALAVVIVCVLLAAAFDVRPKEWPIAAQVAAFAAAAALVAFMTWRITLRR